MAPSVGATQAFHVQTTGTDLRDGFPYFAHHDSVSALWAKWRPACAAGFYPFDQGNVEDFDPIFAELIQISGDDPGWLARPDEYAKPFLPAAGRLVTEAEHALSAGDTARARDLFLRAAVVYRIARYPINRSAVTQEAWDLGKAAYERGGQLLDPPNVSVEIPFTHADTAAGDTDTPIQTLLHLPSGEPPPAGWPVLLLINGLDGYRTDNTALAQVHVEHGFATLSFEIPGTGDCPAAPNDPTSPDRLMSSILDWVAGQAAERQFDPGTVVARGVSTGGYYAMRVAHTHSDRLVAVVAQGGAGHRMFDRAWIGAQNQMEYPFALGDAMAYKFGYREGDLATARAQYAADGHKFSLVESGLLEQPSTRLLVINGMEDSIFPIEDSVIVATSGLHTELVALADVGHMGDPGAEPIIYQWLDDMVAAK